MNERKGELKPVFATKRFARFIVFAGVVASLPCIEASDRGLSVTGDVRGEIIDGAGTPQMGARVSILNRYQRTIASTFSAPDGRFAIPALPVGAYSVHVFLDSFLPASREQILVKPGLESFLQIRLATLFSNIEVNYVLPSSGMSDEWKWVLRASPATRPVTRLVEADDSDEFDMPAQRVPLFSGTHAMLALSGGDSFPEAGLLGTDFGTGFALSTNVFGKNQLQLAGFLGQNAAQPASPALALSVIYSRADQGQLTSPPEVSLTVVQLTPLPIQPLSAGSVEPASGTAIAGLRALTLSTYNALDLLDRMHLEYGATGESVDDVQHLTRVSPYARMTGDLGKFGSLIAAYSNGARPDELRVHQEDTASAAGDLPNNELSTAIDSLSRLPQVSLRNGELKLQRTQNYEAGYAKKSESTTYSVSAFLEDVSNGRLNLAGDLSNFPSGDALSFGLSPVSMYNVGRYSRTGYVASVDERVAQLLDVALAYGRTGGFSSTSGDLFEPGRRSLNLSGHNIASASARAAIPHTGTRIVTNYGWVDARAVIPAHYFTTQNVNVTPGLNISIHQPLPSILGIPCRIELTADLRNMLAQGYVPLDQSGRRLLLVDAPRSFRGGLKFTF